MSDEDLDRGIAALEELDWRQARLSFELALSEEESPEALEGCATASQGLDDIAAAVDLFERAYRLYRESERSGDAARMATMLANAYIEYNGDAAIASGWIQRAQRLLRDEPIPSVAAFSKSIEAYIALSFDKDPVRARQLAEEAHADARASGDPEAELTGLALLGLIQVIQGQVREGLKLLDEAAATALSGEISRLSAALGVCCFLITACARIRDFDRVAQWSRYVMERSGEGESRALFSFPRTELASTLVVWGRWREADQELTAVVNEMESHPLIAAMAMIRLAELQRRRGNLSESQALLDRAAQPRYRSGVAHVLLAARSQLALAKDNIQEALALAERYLRSVPDANFTERIEVLEVVTRARLATGDLLEAGAAAAELSTIAERIGTPALRAIALLSQGLARRAEDPSRAQPSLERAIDLFDAAGMPYEGAIARQELAETHLAMGLGDLARDGFLEAHSTLSSLGAAATAQIADRLDGLGVNGSEQGRENPLTPREREVIQLVAKGLTNDEIAAVLVLSVRTVERHISNLYGKIGAYGRAARAVATAYAHTNGLAD